MHYLPLSVPLFSILAGMFLALAALIQVGILRYAYIRLGMSPAAVLMLLLGSLLGSYFNIPVADLPGPQVLGHREVDFLGMRYAVPIVVDWPGTVIAVNVGGALIPGIVSLYPLIKTGAWGFGTIAIACVAAVCHAVAQPIRGVGIGLPVFVPALRRASWRCCCHAGTPRRWPISVAAWARSSARICSISVRSGTWVRRWPRPAAPARSMVFSWLVSWRC